VPGCSPVAVSSALSLIGAPWSYGLA
jgi:hypothetical protein